MNTNHSVPDNQQLSAVLNNYYEYRARLIPIEATQNGDNRYNDKLPVDFTDSLAGYLTQLLPGLPQ
jgi:hypothetical protein